MTVTDDPVRQQASREATRWLILLQDESDDPEISAEFDAWLAAASVNREAWAQTEKAMGLVARLSPGNTSSWCDSTGRGVDMLRQPRRRIPKRTAWTGSVVALAACVALFFTAPSLLLRLRADAMTGTAETRVLHMADGSEVTLAPGSAVSINNKDGRRSVTLLAGEALFSVVHDPVHPFVVKTGNFTTTDIGTVFDVRRTESGVDVAVRSGRVQVSGGSILAQDRELGAGRGLTASASGFHADERSAEQVGAWADGLLVANDEPLGQVVARLKPYLSGMVIVPSHLSSQRVSGVYSLTDPGRALEAVAQARQGSVHRYSRWLTILR